MIVMKFGGTSNEDAAAMRNVVRIVKSHVAHQPVVVISAIAKATNDLEQAARTAATGNDEEAATIVTRLFERHTRIIDNLISSRPASNELETVLFQYLSEIKSLLKGIAILRELTPRSMDAICSYGERLSSHIIAAALEEAAVKSAWIDAKDFMVTDENFGRAQPIMELVTENLEHRVRPLLNQGRIPVTQGFIGATASGAYTTMGRESSDYSAAIIGAAMNAERVQIWTDVDGILSADPRIAKNTKKLKRLSFEEAFELSYFGAKVLHPGTMLPLLEKNIPVHILNSKREASTGTWVDANPLPSDHTILKSVAFKKDITVITMTPRKRLGQYLFWEGIFSVLNRYSISSGTMTTSEYAVALAVDRRQISNDMIHDLESLGIVTLHNNKGSICLVGKGLREGLGISERVFRALSSMKVMMISHGASESNLTIVIDEEQIPAALQQLHSEFFDDVGVSDLFETLPQQ